MSVSPEDRENAIRTINVFRGGSSIWVQKADAVDALIAAGWRPGGAPVVDREALLEAQSWCPECGGHGVIGTGGGDIRDCPNLDTHIAVARLIDGGVDRATVEREAAAAALERLAHAEKGMADWIGADIDARGRTRLAEVARGYREGRGVRPAAAIRDGGAS